MSAASATALYADLVARGVQLDVRDGRLRDRPKGSVDVALRAAMSDCKRELIELIVATDTAVPGATAETTCGRSVPLSTLSSSDATHQPSGPCYCCRGSKWWRLRGKRDWFCAACAAPGLRTGRIEMRDVASDVTARPGAGLYQSRARSGEGCPPVQTASSRAGQIDVDHVNGADGHA